MLLLSLDTATDRPTLMVGDAVNPGAERALAHRHDLSREIDGVVRELLASYGIGARDLEGVIVADGPGSFTGLRIGIAFAKGVCRALGVPLFSAPSMMGAARATGDGPRVVAVDYDALRGEVYRAVYEFGEDHAVTVLRAPALVAAGSPLPQGARPATAALASARALHRLMDIPGGVALVPDPSSWEPAYGRPAEAEARLKARHVTG